VCSKPDVWVATRADIARHWRAHFPYRPRVQPSRLEREVFLAMFGGVFEHSPFIAARAFDAGLGPAHDTAGGLSSALTAVFRRASAEERLGVLQAHPDLAGRLALAELTEDSQAEQRSAGLDRLTADQLARFTALNERYQARFAIPFIIAVRGLDAAAILEAFERRIEAEPDAELATAAREVEKIARLRIAAILGETA